MRAAVFHGAHDIRIEEVAAPTSPGPREVLVQPSWCGICGTDLHEYLSGPIFIPTASNPHPLTGHVLPQIMGHEFSASVVEVGDDVSGVAVGDRVSVMPLLVCNRCDYCQAGLHHLCSRMGATGQSSTSGGIADLAVLQDYQVNLLPDAVTDIQGAVIEPAAVAAYGVDRAQVRPGEQVLVTGMGPIGSLVALYAYAMGLDVTMVEANPQRLAFAEKLDVGRVLDARDPGVSEGLAAVTAGSGFSAAIECSGNAQATASAVANTRRGGTIVQTGLHTAPASFDLPEISRNDLSYVGSWCYPIRDWPRMIRLVASGKYPVERIVSSQLGIDDAVSGGFDALSDPSGREMKVLITPDVSRAKSGE